jgi:uncharacterized membrane protein YsdA (DUF1294 family)
LQKKYSGDVMKEFLIIYLAVIVVMSIIAFFMYLSDKRKAEKGKWRTPEATLLGVGVLGGAVGALLGMKCFRHKTKHWYFWAVNILALIAHIAIPVAVCLLVF